MKYLNTLNSSLFSMFRKYDNLLLLGEDVVDPYGGAFKVTRGLSTQYPDRVLSTPISEAAITGLAVGAGMRGMKIIVEIMFGDFLALAFDQIFNHLTKYPPMYNYRVPMDVIIRSPVGGGRGYGPTHSQNPEKYFVGMPGLTVLFPSELHNPGNTLRQAIELGGPILFLEGKLLYQMELIGKHNIPQTFQIHHEFHDQGELGSVIFLSNGRKGRADVTMISYGSCFSGIENAASTLLMDDEISIDLFMLENLSRINYSVFQESIQNSGRVLVVEESTRRCGLGAEIAAEINSLFFHFLEKPVVRVASLDQILPTAKHLEKMVLYSPEQIVSAAKELVR